MGDLCKNQWIYICIWKKSGMSSFILEQSSSSCDNTWRWRKWKRLIFYRTKVFAIIFLISFHLKTNSYHLESHSYCDILQLIFSLSHSIVLERRAALKWNEKWVLPFYFYIFHSLPVHHVVYTNVCTVLYKYALIKPLTHIKWLTLFSINLHP